MSSALVRGCVSVENDILVPSLAVTRLSEQAQLGIDLNEVDNVKIFVSSKFFPQKLLLKSKIIGIFLNLLSFG